ncbi:MAG: hypothetical protein BWK73_19130 [Thiothrix lacustris]|uniref:Bacteriophage Mu Gp45 N-terminal domain-containing protein n=1 Tax=Thiothrix lacustris TaxID=525917 RepID=A0A1Y1QPN0_9GAMM|nr:MAG: hypothetical protein BWK73_19130 [Thiothrix lacustris]
MNSLITYGKLLLTYVGKPYTLQVAGNSGTTRDKVHHAQPYGLSAHAQSGAEAVTLQMAGDAASSIVICIADRRYVMELAAGEVALHDDQGQHVHLTREGIMITSDKLVTFDTPLVKCTGDVEISGISFLQHTHPGILPGASSTQPPQ